ncbi:efflux RND transporter permease subunit [Rhodohalobacter sp.]|uniref:efflux RND transporter permease subunit n=1 Tax=Rhodohalobacter sp. TaxID=1974210 RepID=UPI002ACEF4E9|nr:MMPL family transporter [Rhodohalobacter sp.]MDZ7757343.1 MMPL family transporter [Rhodohalobacter sp.]
MKQFGEFILAHPKSVLFGLTVLLFVSIFPASNIRTDFNLEGFYPDEDPVIADYEKLEDEFGRDDNSIIIGFKTDSLFTKEVLLDLQSITAQLEEIDYLTEVLSILDAQEIKSENGELTFDPYFDLENSSKERLSNIKENITHDPFLNGALINSSGNATAIVLRINEEENTFFNRNHIIDSINDVLREYRSDYEFHTSGIPYFRNQYVNLLNGEIVMYIAISSILIILLLWYIYRTIWGVLFPMVIVWSTLLLTVAIIQLTGGYLEIMSSTIAPILLCVGVADAIHMISKYDDARESGFSKHNSIIEMLKTLGSATFLTSLTTAIGFATLFTSTVMPMRRFGIYTAVGVLLAYVVTIFFLPVILSRLKSKRIFDEKSGSFYPLLQKWLNKVAGLNRLNYRKIIIFGLLVTIMFSVGITKIDVNGKVFDDVGDDTELMQDSQFFSDQIAPQFPMEFLIDTGEPDGALSADLLERVSRFEQKLLEYPEIHRVVGFHTLMGEVHRVLTDGERNENLDFPLPESDQAIAQYTLLMEINEADELYNLVDFDYTKLRITAQTEDAGSKRINEIRDEFRSEMQRLFPDEEVIVTGTTILSADLTDKIVYSLAWSIMLAIFAITLIMAMLFKSFKMALIALVPNIIPLVIVGGVMGFAGVDIKPSTAVIFTIALGIAVDDSIHYLARFRIEYLKSKAMFPSLTATTVRTGRAIIVTSLILIAGFGTLITSAFTSTAMMGILVCTTILGALLADLFVLPSLFYWLKPKLKI